MPAPSPNFGFLHYPDPRLPFLGGETEGLGGSVRQAACEALDEAVFADAGGTPKASKTFEGKLEHVLGDLHEAIGKDAG